MAEWSIDSLITFPSLVPFILFISIFCNIHTAPELAATIDANIEGYWGRLLF
jgi:hypothetical protein